MLALTEDHSGGIIPFRGQEAPCDATGIVAGWLLNREVNHACLNLRNGQLIARTVGQTSVMNQTLGDGPQEEYWATNFRSESISCAAHCVPDVAYTQTQRLAEPENSLDQCLDEKQTFGFHLPRPVRFLHQEGLTIPSEDSCMTFSRSPRAWRR